MKIPFELIYLITMSLSAITSLNAFRLGWPLALKLFSVFLFVTLSVELFAVSWKYQLYHTPWWHYNKSNLWLYNSYLIPQYLFYIFFFSRITKLPKAGLLSVLLFVGYGLLGLGNLLFVQGFHTVNYFTIIAANLIMIFFCINYFITLMKADTVVRLRTQPMFWITVGAFIFHLGSLPCFVLYNAIFEKNMAVASFWFIATITVSNFIMYLFYAIAFLCTLKYPKSPY